MLTRHRKVRRGRKAPSPTFDRKVTVQLNRLDEYVGYQLRMAYVAARRRFEAATERLGLTQKQTGVLWLIGANGGVSQIALATKLGMDRASMMAIVDRLEERGLIVRKRSRDDGRRQELYVTAKGRKALGQAKSALAAHEKWLAGKFSARELNAFIGALRRIGD